MIGWFEKNDFEVKPQKVPASLFSRDEGYSVSGVDGLKSIKFDLLVDESHTLEFEASDHPIENGAVITDHVTQKLRTCTITAMFTNTPDETEIEGEDVSTYQNGSAEEGLPLTHNRSRDDLFAEIERLAMQRKPVRLVTALKVYPEMIILSVPVKRTSEDGESVKFQMTLREFKTANLKKTLAFGKFNPPNMKTDVNRTIANKNTNGKVSAKEEQLVDNAISGGGFNQ